MSLIRAYGEFWRKEALNRRQRESRDQAWLGGTALIRGRRVAVDAWRQRGIYVLHSDYKPVYVGQAGLATHKSLGSRLRDHLHDRHAGRWDTFSWYGVLEFKNKGAHVREPVPFKERRVSQDELIDTLEAVGIAIADPPLNRARARIPGAVHVEPAEVEAQLTTDGQLQEVYKFVRDQKEREKKVRQKQERRKRAPGRRPKQRPK